MGGEVGCCGVDSLGDLLVAEVVVVVAVVLVLLVMLP